jgi:hypothetical protein
MGKALYRHGFAMSNQLQDVVFPEMSTHHLPCGIFSSKSVQGTAPKFLVQGSTLMLSEFASFRNSIRCHVLGTKSTLVITRTMKDRVASMFLEDTLLMALRRTLIQPFST